MLKIEETFDRGQSIFFHSLETFEVYSFQHEVILYQTRSEVELIQEINDPKNPQNISKNAKKQIFSCSM
jgi:hypothetical protein